MTDEELNQAVEVTHGQAQIVARLLKAEGLTPRVRKLVEAHQRDVRQLHDRLGHRGGPVR